MGLFKTRVDENWKINYIKEFNEMRSEFSTTGSITRFPLETSWSI